MLLIETNLLLCFYYFLLGIDVIFSFRTNNDNIFRSIMKNCIECILFFLLHTMHMYIMYIFACVLYMWAYVILSLLFSIFYRFPLPLWWLLILFLWNISKCSNEYASSDSFILHKHIFYIISMTSNKFRYWSRQY